MLIIREDGYFHKTYWKNGLPKGSLPRLSGNIKIAELFEWIFLIYIHIKPINQKCFKTFSDMHLHAPFKNWFEIIHIYHRKNRNYTWAEISTNHEITLWKQFRNKSQMYKYMYWELLTKKKEYFYLFVVILSVRAVS